MEFRNAMSSTPQTRLKELNVQTLRIITHDRLDNLTSALAEVLHRQSSQERNAMFHDLNEVRAKYARKLDTHKRLGNGFQVSGCKRQCTLQFQSGGPSCAAQHSSDVGHAPVELSQLHTKQETDVSKTCNWNWPSAQANNASANAQS